MSKKQDEKKAYARLKESHGGKRWHFALKHKGRFVGIRPDYGLDESPFNSDVRLTVRGTPDGEDEAKEIELTVPVVNMIRLCENFLLVIQGEQGGYDLTHVDEEDEDEDEAEEGSPEES